MTPQEIAHIISSDPGFYQFCQEVAERMPHQPGQASPHEHIHHEAAGCIKAMALMPKIIKGMAESTAEPGTEWIEPWPDITSARFTETRITNLA